MAGDDGGDTGHTLANSGKSLLARINSENNKPTHLTPRQYLPAFSKYILEFFLKLCMIRWED